MAKKKKGGFNLKEIDVKKFLLDKGERVGLWAAVVIMALLVVLGLGIKGLSSGSPTKNAEPVVSATRQVKGAMDSSKAPTELVVPPPDLAAAVSPKPVDMSQHPFVIKPFWPSGLSDTKWRLPGVLGMEEFQGQVLLTQVMDYYFTDDGKVMMRVAKGEANEADKAKDADFQARFQANPRRKRPRGIAPPPQGAMPANPGDPKQETVMLQPISMDEMAKVNGKPAKVVHPYRMVIVEGAFPYKAQLDAIRSALLYPTIDDMLKDKDRIFIDAEGKEPTIAFLGLQIERRTVSSEGKASDWKAVDLEAPYRDMRFLSVGAVPENAELLNYGIVVRQVPSRMVMPRPELARASLQWPDLAGSLEKIQASLLTMQNTFKEKAPPVILTPNRFQKDQFDPFQTPGAKGEETKPMATPGGATGTATPATPANAPVGLVPDYCLVRFLDVTVQPGQTYEYRVAVKMANPLYKRDELALAQTYTQQPVLMGPPQEVTVKSNGKSIPLQLRVPGEEFYYAVDEKPAGLKFVPPVDQEKAAVQIQRWLEQVQVNPGNKNSAVPVGEWSVLERVLVKRGEHIGRPDKVEIPIWDPSQETFILASSPEDPRARRMGTPQKGVLVDFGTDALLVDFEGGGTRGPEELLVLTPDGKLIVRDGRVDSEDLDRKRRVKEWQDRLDEVKNGGKKKPGENNIFGGMK